MFQCNGSLNDGRILVVEAVGGIAELWGETLGDLRVCIAVLDGPVDQTHLSLSHASLTQLETLAPSVADLGPANQHGSHIASVIFGKHDGNLCGIAPNCRGLVVPIFGDGNCDTLAPCSQIDLARAILQAAQQGAHVINVSGGQYTPSGAAHPFLTEAVRHCEANNILIVAAAGNEGCECLHVPAALPSVLAVGAMNDLGMPMEFSNWGNRYQTNGILAPGENILGARAGGGFTHNSGTSFATAIVAGVAGLLLSLQLKLGRQPDPEAVRAALIYSAVGCRDQPIADCRRLLAGRLHVKRAMSCIIQGIINVSDPSQVHESPRPCIVPGAEQQVSGVPKISPGVQAAAFDSTGPGGTVADSEPSNLMTPPGLNYGVHPQQSPVAFGQVMPSACGCGGAIAAPAQLVFALGQLGFDFGTEARRDSIFQHMTTRHTYDGAVNPYDARQLLEYLEQNPWDAASINWTLSLDATSIYVIQPKGAFALETYQRLREFLRDQGENGVERVSIPGVIAGKTRLMNGQTVPVIVPEIRGMYSWTTAALVNAVIGSSPAGKATQEVTDAFDTKARRIHDFLNRVYFEIRNLGVIPQERAINFSATNAFNIERVFEDALKEEMDLDTIQVVRSAICRPESDCWDVMLNFFFPQRQVQTVRKVFRFTVDVSDVVPVTVGPMRSWFVR